MFSSNKIQNVTQDTGGVHQRVASPARLEHIAMLLILDFATIVQLDTVPTRKKAPAPQIVTYVKVPMLLN